MLGRQRTGSLLCTSCGVLVGVNDGSCYNCGRRNPGLWGYAPLLRSLGQDLGFVPFVMGTCIVIYALTLVFSRGAIGMGGLLSLMSPSPTALYVFGSSGSLPVFGFGRWWTLLSAGWLHGGILHLFFNLMGLRQLAPAIATLYGPGRMVIIYIVASVTGFGLSSFAGAYIPNLLILRGSQFTVGASASLFGLLGAAVYYGRRTGSRHVTSVASSWVMSAALFGFLVPGIDNYAHLGGFGGGYLVSQLLDPLKPERIDHIAIALVCLAASLLSVAVSVYLGI